VSLPATASAPIIPAHPQEHAMPEWSKYQSHKTVQAAPIHEIVDSGGKLSILVKPYGDNTVEGFEPTEPGMLTRCAAGDYAMIYRDGYRSVCPKKEFEDGYTRLP
jgi:hypothetical protein